LLLLHLPQLRLPRLMLPHRRLLLLLLQRRRRRRRGSIPLRTGLLRRGRGRAAREGVKRAAAAANAAGSRGGADGRVGAADGEGAGIAAGLLGRPGSAGVARVGRRRRWLAGRLEDGLDSAAAAGVLWGCGDVS
jgi:hypothetical protein